MNNNLRCKKKSQIKDHKNMKHESMADIQKGGKESQRKKNKKEKKNDNNENE